MTVVAACKEVGIPRSTFYDVVKKKIEVIAEYLEIVDVKLYGSVTPSPSNHSRNFPKVSL